MSLLNGNSDFWILWINKTGGMSLTPKNGFLKIIAQNTGCFNSLLNCLFHCGRLSLGGKHVLYRERLTLWDDSVNFPAGSSAPTALLWFPSASAASSSESPTPALSDCINRLSFWDDKEKIKSKSGRSIHRRQKEMNWGSKRLIKGGKEKKRTG